MLAPQIPLSFDFRWPPPWVATGIRRGNNDYDTFLCAERCRDDRDELFGCLEGGAKEWPTAELRCGASLEDDTGGRRRNSRAASLEESSQGGHMDSAPYGCRFSQEWVELNRDLTHIHQCSWTSGDPACEMNDRRSVRVTRVA